MCARPSAREFVHVSAVRDVHGEFVAESVATAGLAETRNGVQSFSEICFRLHSVHNVHS